MHNKNYIIFIWICQNKLKMSVENKDEKEEEEDEEEEDEEEEKNGSKVSNGSKMKILTCIQHSSFQNSEELAVLFAAYLCYRVKFCLKTMLND